MSHTVDFLNMDWREAEACLLRWRERLNNSLPPSERIEGSCVVILVALAGGADHRRHHPDAVFHHVEFMETCRRLLKASGAKVLSAELDGTIPDLVCAWLPARAALAVVAAARIHEHFRRANELYRPPWMHEKHALVAIGSTEYATIPLLSVAWRDQTLIEPSLWATLDEDFRHLAQVIQVAVPELPEVGEAVRRGMRDVLRDFHRSAPSRNPRKHLEFPVPVT